MSNDFTPVKVNAAIVTAGQNCWQIGNFYVSAQPTEAGLAVASSLGIKSVICLRDALETAYLQFLPFDPEEDRTLSTTLGMSFVNIPFPHDPTDSQFNISQEQFNIRARAVLAVLNLLPQPLLMHCSSGDRASALWAVHLIVNCGVGIETAVDYATISGLAVFLPYVKKYPQPSS
ncbi:MAG TPA: hypothetical protein VK581_00030 [Chthoniobacterales bacterium]|nr:hypothetical protein [Chthoniobacterales bacterium]